MRGLGIFFVSGEAGLILAGDLTKSKLLQMKCVGCDRFCGDNRSSQEKTMETKRKRWSELTTKELAAATKEFDDPNYNPPAVRPSAKQLAQLRRWKRKRAAEKSELTLMLEHGLIEKADEYAASRGMTFSDLVARGLRQVMKKKSA
jgi:hypothetical protein